VLARGDPRGEFIGSSSPGSPRRRRATPSAAKALLAENKTTWLGRS
jgi:hypothetical protein